MEEKEVVKAEPTKEDYIKLIEGLKSQNAQLMYHLQNANMNNIFKRLDYLFKVLENAPMFDEVFLNQCIEEVKVLMTLPTEEEGSEEETKN